MRCTQIWFVDIQLINEFPVDNTRYLKARNPKSDDAPVTEAPAFQRQLSYASG